MDFLKNAQLRKDLHETFKELDNVFHILDMYAKGEEIKNAPSIPTDGSNIKILIEQAIDFIILKPNYQKESFERLFKYSIRIDNLKCDYEKYRLDKDSLQKRVDFMWLTGSLEEISHDIIIPFYRRHSDKNVSNNIPDILSSISFISDIEDAAINESDQSFTKITWKGTPGEFGAIMNELINNGFISKVKDLKNTVRLLHSAFEVRNEKGDTVDLKYLYKCFSEKKKNYYPHEFKIPISDNLNKPK